MALTSSEFDAVYNNFLSTCSLRKSEKNKFLAAVNKEFGYSDVIDLRRNLTVVLERNGHREIHAYAQSSGRFYQIAGNAVDTVE